MKRNNIIWI